MERLKSLHIRMPFSWHRKLKIMAAQRRTTMTALIFETVNKELRKHQIREVSDVGHKGN